MVKKKYLIVNLVYGNTYTKLFTEQHLKSLLDPTNLPAIKEKYDVEYLIFSDKDTARQLTFHPNMVELAKHVRVHSSVFEFPPGVNRYNFRYALILTMVKEAIKRALEQDAYLTVWVADLVVAKEFFPRVLSKMDEGHGAVFVVPLRTGSEAVVPALNKVHGALEAKALCTLGIECLHPLWVAAFWRNPLFTRLPFTLLWQGRGGMLGRTFQPTPIVFNPKKEMLESRGMIDGDIPALCENPYWATDWVDAPVMGVEPLICFFPPHANRPATTAFIKDYFQNLHPTQLPYLKQYMYYPSKAEVIMDADQVAESDRVVAEVCGGD